MTRIISGLDSIWFHPEAPIRLNRGLLTPDTKRRYESIILPGLGYGIQCAHRGQISTVIPRSGMQSITLRRSLSLTMTELYPDTAGTEGDAAVCDKRGGSDPFIGAASDRYCPYVSILSASPHHFIASCLHRFVTAPMCVNLACTFERSQCRKRQKNKCCPKIDRKICEDHMPSSLLDSS